MNLDEDQETPPITVKGTKVSLPKSKQELLGEVTEKALGQRKKNEEETQRAVEQLKGELQHKIEEECHHKVD
jgi:phenylpyruvate tautomerase PptA (4-oxalocrotonate tautomerase family)